MKRFSFLEFIVLVSRQFSVADVCMYVCISCDYVDAVDDADEADGDG